MSVTEGKYIGGSVVLSSINIIEGVTNHLWPTGMVT